MTYRKALPSGNVPVAYSTFCQFWQDLVPDFVVMKPMTDLCLECQQHSTALQLCTNLLPQDKSATLAMYSNHLMTVHLERTYVNMQVDMCKQSLKECLTSRGKDKFPPLPLHMPSNSVDITSHLSFDDAQQVNQKNQIEIFFTKH